MNVKLNPREALALQCFLADMRNPKMPKTFRVQLAKFHDDVKRHKVNSDRFNHVLPVLKALHGSALTGLDQACKYRNITRWKRRLVFPGLWEYFFRILPFFRHKRAVLNQAATVLRTLAKQCEKIAVSTETKEAA